MTFPRRRHNFWPLWVAASAGTLVLAGCGTPTTSNESANASQRVPTTHVPKLDAWRDAELLASRGSGRSSAVGSGESMAPVYGDATMLVIEKVAFERLQRGMTVAYRSYRGRRVVHQLLEPTSSGWRVQGLNNDAADRERVTEENLIGVVYASLASDRAEDRP